MRVLNTEANMSPGSANAQLKILPTIVGGRSIDTESKLDTCAVFFGPSFPNNRVEATGQFSPNSHQRMLSRTVRGVDAPLQHGVPMS